MSKIKTIKGEGEIVTKTLNIAQFRNIVLTGTDDVFIKQGVDQSITVIGNDNIIQRLITDVTNDTWTIKLKKVHIKLIN